MSDILCQIYLIKAGARALNRVLLSLILVEKTIVGSSAVKHFSDD